MKRVTASMRKVLINRYFLCVLLPGIVLVCFASIMTRSALVAAIGILLPALQVIYLYMLHRTIRIRLEEPMVHFRSALEDISEGFIVDALPEEPFAEAEPEISDAARQVLHINRMMLRNVDNLEKGYEEERLAKLRQAELTQAYERFVPKEFLSYLHKDSITDVRLGDHIETRMTVMFADMRAFTTLSEQIQPEDNFRFLNTYFAQMEPVVQAHNGFIDKYIGDGIMALFRQDSDAALDASIAMFERMGPYNEERGRQGLPPVRIGIGLNTGRLMLGIVGGRNRMEGTVISDAVNVASRLEDLNKLYGTEILLSEQAYQSLKNPEKYGIRRIDRVTVKGKSQSIGVYEVFDINPKELRSFKAETKERYEEALNLLLSGRTEEAGLLFGELAEAHPGDTAARYQAEYCFALRNMEAGKSKPQLNQEEAGEEPT